MPQLQTHSPDAPAAAPAARLQHLPVSFFSVVLGLGGLAVAWARAEQALGLPRAPSGLLTLLAAAVFAVLFIAYLAKAVWHTPEVRAEFRHPVRANFVPAISISMVLLSMAIHGQAAGAAHALWLVGTGLHLTLTVITINRWMHHPGIEIGHLSPAWFIPVVGNVLVPILGVKLYPAQVSWFFFSIGMTFWLVLLTLVMNRLFFHGPMPERMRATLFILVAPPAVGTVAYLGLAQEVDAVAHVLYSLAIFFTLLMATQAPLFLRARFYLSAWATSFPLAAVTIASFAMAQATGAAGYALMGMLLLAVLTVVVGALALRTAVGVARREICVPE